MKKATKRTAKGEQKKQSISGQRQRREKKGAGGAETGAAASSIPVSQISHEKRVIYDLLDFSTDWQMPARAASTAEVEAHFYYEFARESETIVSLTETL